MSGLILKLNPKERVLINGAVIENGDRRSKFRIMTPKANMLRLRDAINPEKVNTPVRRACYMTQLVLTGDVDPEGVQSEILAQINQLKIVFIDQDSRNHLTNAANALIQNQYYYCLKALRGLLTQEDHLLGGTPA